MQIRMLLVSLVLVLLLYGCAGQELCNVANQQKYECSKIHDWGDDVREIIENTMLAMNTIAEEFAAILREEDQQVKLQKLQKLDTELSSIGEALYSIDIVEPLKRAERIEKCADALIDYTGETPEEANEHTLALHLFRLKQAQLKFEQLKNIKNKAMATISTVIPGGTGWLDTLIKAGLALYGAYTTVRSVQENRKKKKAERNFSYTVQGIRGLKTNKPELYEEMKNKMTDTVPREHKDELDAEVARVVNKVS